MTVSAPGKLLLLGDHAVVYGYPCITTAVSVRLEVTIEETGDGKITVDAPPVKDTRFVDAAIDSGLRDWNIRHNGFRLVTKSAFSETYGFGSSSAVTVATLYALASLFKKDFSTRQIFDMAYQIILAIQAVGSGFDVASAAFGGTIYYVKGGKPIEHLSIKDMPLIVGYTGIKSNTVDLVRMVGKKREQYPEKVERIFQAIAKLVEEAKLRMLEGDWERVGKLMDFNQEYLRDLGVSSEKLEALISAAKGAGAWGAKLSGAGGGDCMIALAPGDKREAINTAIREAGGQEIDVRANAEGVRIET